MNNYFSTATLLLLLAPGCGGDGNNGTAQCPAAWLTAPTVDPSIALPADAGALVVHAAATGTQNYMCTATGGDATTAPTYAWTLVAPAATLADCTGTTIGDHSAPTGAAAPEWSNRDGSVIVGHRVASFTADATAIPWLLLAASSHTGTGVMNNVAYVQRVNTSGGKASAPCDAAHVGATSNVPYSADYYFFGNR